MKVIYEDNHIIVVEKMANIPSQGDKTGDIDMLSMIKEYLTIVNGKMEEEKSTLTDYLWKDEKKNTSYVVKQTKKNAKLASLDYEVLKYDEKNDVSLLKVNLHTGRHHQIRVQFSSRMHAIYGNNKYHGRGAGTGICLWAYKLTIIHPTTKEEMSFEALPERKGMWEILKGFDQGDVRYGRI